MVGGLDEALAAAHVGVLGMHETDEAVWVGGPGGEKGDFLDEGAYSGERYRRSD